MIQEFDYDVFVTTPGALMKRGSIGGDNAPPHIRVNFYSGCSFWWWHMRVDGTDYWYHFEPGLTPEERERQVPVVMDLLRAAGEIE